MVSINDIKLSEVSIQYCLYNLILIWKFLCREKVRKEKKYIWKKYGQNYSNINSWYVWEVKVNIILIFFKFFVKQIWGLFGEYVLFSVFRG